MEIKKSLSCREIRKSDVIGSDNEKLGRIGDMTFTFNGTLSLTHFILAGPAFEEFLESIKIRPNRDPVFDASMIKRIDEKVYLNTSRNSLKTTLDKDSIGKDEIKLSKLEKLSIYDQKGVSVGKAIDVEFDVDGCASLIVGGGFFEEKLEALGLKADVDIIVPAQVIKSIGETIDLNVDKENLSLTMEEAVKSEMAAKAKDDMVTHRQISKVRLYAQRPI
ncbi:MAG: PRC-barrel domain-containing protein [Candidatus Thorarchaeota archaeon]